ncbi:MAG: DUF1653 domain-containing protein [Lachnoclostridium sp.]
MEERKMPKPGQIYKHFKNNLYQIITVATHTETGEKMVVYQALYGNFKTYVRPLKMFMEKVDKDKYPEAKQKFRFELVNLNDEEENSFQTEEVSVKAEKSEINEESNFSETEIKTASETDTIDEQDSINPILMEFLDATSYEEKLRILLNNKKDITDKILSEMAMSIDCTLGEGNTQDRIEEFVFCLETHARFENKRLR